MLTTSRSLAYPAALSRRLDSVRTLTMAGTVGSALMAFASFWIGAIPAYFHGSAGLSWLPGRTGTARGLYYLGFGLLALSWLALGHLVLQTQAPAWQAVRRAALAWSAPMLLTVPVASRDLWAYAAQGDTANHGLNPYTHVPFEVPGIFLDNMTPRWSHVVSPYGPLWTMLSRAAVTITGPHLMSAVLLLRLISVLGLVMLALTLPALAERFGGRAGLTCWAVLANPIFVVHMVGGGHNDLLMVGLTSVGIYLATNRAMTTWQALVLGGVVIALASAIKFPAIVVVPFLPLLRMRGLVNSGDDDDAPISRGDWPELARGLGVAFAGYLVTTVVLSLAAGYGFSWLKAASGPGHGGGALGSSLIVVSLVVIWLLAWRWPVVAMTTAAYSAVIFITPIAANWYWGWAFAVGATVLVRRISVAALATASMTLVMLIQPNGLAFRQRIETIALVCGLLVWLVLDRRFVPVGVRAARKLSDGARTDSSQSAADDDADRAGAGVDAHRRRDL